MYGAVNYIREKDWAPEDLQIHPMWSTPKCWMKAWRNRDGPRGVSHTAEWTGLSGSSELTPRGRGRRQRGLFVCFFFPWMVNTGILGTQEKELGGGDRRGTWLHEVGLELVREGEQKAAGFPPPGEVGEGVPSSRSGSGGQACALSAEKRSGDLVWPDFQRSPCNKVTKHKRSKKRKAELKQREAAVVAKW